MRGFLAVAIVAQVNAFNLVLESVSKYPGYQGELNVKVAVPISVAVQGDVVFMSGYLSGLPPDTLAGIHIHEAISCDSLGHYWEGTETDPWTAIKYTSDANGEANIQLNVKLNIEAVNQLNGRVIVVHSLSEKIACGKLVEVSPREYLTGEISPYPGLSEATPAEGTFQKYFDYTGDIVATGVVTLSTSNVLQWNLAGLEPSITGGIHIHTGKTCAQTAGDHYFLATVDPWLDINYISTTGGAAVGSLDLNETLGVYHVFENNIDHAVVIHDSQNVRISCALLSRPINVFGNVKLFQNVDGTIELEGWAQNVQCSEGVTAGFHIHEGASCRNSGNHLLNADGIDPWLGTTYTSAVTVQNTQEKCRTKLQSTFGGFALTSLQTKPVVLHDSSGKRIACAMLGRSSPSSRMQALTVASLNAYPGYAGNLALQVDRPLMFFMDPLDRSVTLEGTISGLDDAASVSVHIHSGSSCENAMGHFWEPYEIFAADPWLASIHPVVDGVAKLSMKLPFFGASSQANAAGRVVVAHVAGVKVACGYLYEPSSPVNAKFKLYPGISDSDSAKGNFVKYIESDTVLKVQGNASLATDNTFNWNIEGLAPDASFSIHIHEGRSCNADSGLHFFDAGNGKKGNSDPWVASTYTTDSVGQSAESITLDTSLFFYPFDDNVDRTIVIHDSTTARVACAPLARVQAPFGYIKAETNNGLVELTGWAEGLQYAPLEVGGFHVHAGDSCEDAKGHLLAADGTDSWISTTYKLYEVVNDATVFVRADLHANTTKFTLDQVQGKPVVIHDSNGKRVACALIEKPVLPQSVQVTSVSKYPGYTGGVSVFVDETITFTGGPDGLVKLTGKLSGLIPGNLSGIHIHEGSNCSNAGGHYWRGSQSDPWLVSKFTPDMLGQVSLDITIPRFDLSDTLGRVVVIHTSADKVACGVIGESADTQFISTGTISPYPGMADTADGKIGAYLSFDAGVSGTVSLSPDNVFSWNLEGLEADVTGGVHIHVGTSCAEESGAHYVQQGASDLWTDVKYTSTASGAAVGSLDMKSEPDVYMPFEDNVNHVVVIHSRNNTKVGCAVLTRVQEAFGAVKAFTNAQGKLELQGWAQNVQTSHGMQAGWHVHEGTTCANAGGHLKLADGTDPWLTTLYNISVTQQGDKVKARTTLFFDKEIDLTLDDVAGKTVVLHDSNGKRIACAPLLGKTIQNDPDGKTDETTNATSRGSAVVAVVVILLLGATGAALYVKREDILEKVLPLYYNFKLNVMQSGDTAVKESPKSRQGSVAPMKF